MYVCKDNKSESHSNFKKYDSLLFLYVGLLVLHTQILLEFTRPISLVALSTYQLLVICASVKIPHIYLYKFTDVEYIILQSFDQKSP